MLTAKKKNPYILKGQAVNGHVWWRCVCFSIVNISTWLSRKSMGLNNKRSDGWIRCFSLRVLPLALLFHSNVCVLPPSTFNTNRIIEPNYKNKTQMKINQNYPLIYDPWTKACIFPAALFCLLTLVFPTFSKNPEACRTTGTPVFHRACKHPEMRCQNSGWDSYLSCEQTI